MKESINKKDVSIKELEESGLYDQRLLDCLKLGKFQELSSLPIEKRACKEFMEPLLYAVRNDERLKTYKVYSYYAENLQNDMRLAAEIIQEEPELIEDTPVSYNKQFILDNVETKPEIVKYMGSTLKTDVDFVDELCAIEKPEVVNELTKDISISTTIMNDMELRENKQFLILSINEDANNIKFASEDLKSDYIFIKQSCEENSGVIDYVADNTVEFGVKGLKAAEDVIVDNSSKNAIEDFEEETKVVKKRIEEESDSDKLEELLKKEKQLERHAQFFRDIRDGKRDPVRAARLMNVLCKNLDEDYRKKLEQILTISEAIKEREQQEKEKTEKQENSDREIEINDVEKTTENAKIDEINEDTRVIKEGIMSKVETKETEEGRIDE